LDTLFRRGIEAGRRIRRLGAFDRHPSVAELAVETVGHLLGGLEGRRVGVLGAGLTGQRAVGALLAAGAQVTLLNRSRRRLATLREEMAGERVERTTLEGLPAALATVDALVCATSAPSAVVRETMAAEAIGGRGGRPLLVVDIAVPRDVEPEVGELPGVRLLNVDDLAARSELDDGARREALERAEAAARAEAGAVMAALERRTAGAEIAALRARAAAIREGELRRVQGRLRGLTERQRATVEQLTHAIVQKLLHPPTIALRRAAGGGAAARRARAAILATLTDPSSQRRA
jgi:glutamyl-tRNA reductase